MGATKRQVATLNAHVLQARASAERLLPPQLEQ
jgi:hypothetical protein